MRGGCVTFAIVSSLKGMPRWFADIMTNYIIPKVCAIDVGVKRRKINNPE